MCRGQVGDDPARGTSNNSAPIPLTHPKQGIYIKYVKHIGGYRRGGKACKKALLLLDLSGATEGTGGRKMQHLDGAF